MSSQKFKEAAYYQKLAGQRVLCTLCPRACQIREGEIGFCGARKNISGILYSLIYAEVSSIANDPIEKKPLFQFHPGSRVLSVGTLGCNLGCLYCQNFEIAHRRVGEVATQKILSKNLIELALKNDCEGVAFTYNEPTIWFEYVKEAAQLAKENGLYTVLVTNGYINPLPLKEMGRYLDAFALDIKAFDEDNYQKLASLRDFSPILETAKIIKRELLKHLEIITLLVPDFNDSEKEVRAISRFIKNELGADTPWHLSRFFPRFKMSDYRATPLERLERAAEIGREEGLFNIYLGNI